MTFVRDNELTKTGFGTYDLAVVCAQETKAKLNDPKELKFRVRIRARTRTGMWDVVVKVKRDEKEKTA